MGKLTECKNEVAGSNITLHNAGSNITLLNVLRSLNRIITHRANTLLSTHHQYLSTDHRELGNYGGLFKVKFEGKV